MPVWCHEEHGIGYRRVVMQKNKGAEASTEDQTKEARMHQNQRDAAIKGAWKHHNRGRAEQTTTKIHHGGKQPMVCRNRGCKSIENKNSKMHYHAIVRV